jgi:hypothetical protein
MSKHLKTKSNKKNNKKQKSKKIIELPLKIKIDEAHYDRETILKIEDDWVQSGRIR